MGLFVFTYTIREKNMGYYEGKIKLGGDYNECHC